MDLNADLGEGFGNWSMGDDAALLAIVTSANIACGFHAGDPSIIRKTVDTATRLGVCIGAHVSYPDLRGFGRRDQDLPAEQITDDVLYQIGALDAFARAAGSPVAYVKPHGALYNRMAVDPTTAAAVVAALTAYDRPLPLLTLPGSAATTAAEHGGIRSVSEGFADRAYHHDGRLVHRKTPGAVFDDRGMVSTRALRMARDGEVETIDGSLLHLRIDSLCVHGDTPGAVQIAAAVRESLQGADIPLAPFAVNRP